MKESFQKIANLFHRVDPSATFAFEFWDGSTSGFGSHPAVLLRLKTPKAAEQILKKGFYGLGEAYVSGAAEIEGDLRELLRLGFASRIEESGSRWLHLLHRLRQRCMTRIFPYRPDQDVPRHYDLGDELFALFLDPTMTYSCAYFKSGDVSLQEAQLSKYDHIARKLLLQPGERLLDVGCGWGGMLIFAARNYQTDGLGNTLSRNQYEYARRKILELGLNGRVEVVLQDYRQCTGKFDKFVSIGMLEHVGKDFLGDYMKKVAGLLKKGGLGLLHTIGKETESITDPWITRYIFPGGYLPSLAEIVGNMGRAGLSILDIENLRLHYSRTLDHWAANFDRNLDRARSLFGEKFVRMWRFYLLSCSAGFRHGATRVYQVLFSNGLNNDLPTTRDHLYPAKAPGWAAFEEPLAGCAS